MAARRLARLIARQHWFRCAQTLAAYVANDGEIDPAPLLRMAQARGKRVLLPRLRYKRLQFVQYYSSATLRRNRFNIPEPNGVAIPIRCIDVVCVPLVGFDRAGRRLGMGGGFYDRTFGPSHGSKKALRGGKIIKRRPRLIGLAHACQEFAVLPHEAWDVRLDGVLTERESIRAI